MTSLNGDLPCSFHDDDDFDESEGDEFVDDVTEETELQFFIVTS